MIEYDNITVQVHRQSLFEGAAICIFTAMVIGSLVNLFLSLAVAFDDHQRLRPEVFRNVS